MEALVKLVAEKTGISEEQATTAVQTVVVFLRDKLPGNLGEQVEAYVKGTSTGGLSDINNVTGTIGSMFGKK